MSVSKEAVVPCYNCGQSYEVGEEMFDQRICCSSDSFVHVVADGAPWIKDISKQTFGQNSKFTIDLYHACEYLAQTSHACSLKESHQRWTTRQKNILLKGGVEKVISNMMPFPENVKTSNIDAPVRCAIRYFKNRLDCFDYPMAKQYNLPVGSGVIEGGHRHVIQKRLKKPGMALLKKNAQAMLQARCLIANDQFDEYWKKKAA